MHMLRKNPREASWLSVTCSNMCSALQIAYLENGRVVEAGSHSELLRKGGKYAHLWNQQATNVQENLEAVG